MKPSQILAVTQTLESDIVLKMEGKLYDLSFVEADNKKIVLQIWDEYIEKTESAEVEFNDF